MRASTLVGSAYAFFFFACVVALRDDTDTGDVEVEKLEDEQSPEGLSVERGDEILALLKSGDEATITKGLERLEKSPREELADGPKSKIDFQLGLLMSDYNYKYTVRCIWLMGELGDEGTTRVLGATCGLGQCRAIGRYPQWQRKYGAESDCQVKCKEAIAKIRTRVASSSFLQASISGERDCPENAEICYAKIMSSLTSKDEQKINTALEKLEKEAERPVMTENELRKVDFVLGVVMNEFSNKFSERCMRIMGEIGDESTTHVLSASCELPQFEMKDTCKEAIERIQGRLFLRGAPSQANA